jgi:soluble lytic murein transglycosylase-like protein
MSGPTQKRRKSSYMQTFHRAVRTAGAMLVIGALAVTTVNAAPLKTDEAAKAAAIERANAIFGKLEFFKPIEPQGGTGEKAGASAVKGPANLNGLIAKYAAAEGVPVALAHAVIRVESNYRTNARGRAGEIGLMQIKPATARGMGFTGSAKALYDPATNLRWGMKYLGKAHQLGRGSTCGTILRYNAGHGAKRMNKISAAYCGKVKQVMRRA